MGLKLQEISLFNYRNFHQKEITFEEGFSILIGHNAVGKTNIVEAIQLLTTGKSFRNPTSVQLINDKAERSEVCARLGGDSRIIDYSMTIEPEKKTFKRNGKLFSPARDERDITSILFYPDDLSLIKRGALLRRKELDIFGCVINTGYAEIVSTYTKTLEQRNHLLKETFIANSLLDAWDESLAKGGAAVLYYRQRLFARLSQLISEVYSSISSTESLTCRYISSLIADTSDMEKEELYQLFLHKLQVSRQDDLRRQQTLIGPHRDDVVFYLNNKDAHQYASQGQQRSIVLAIKIAEVLLTEIITSKKPLLLLDDVMSELDENRRQAIVTYIQDSIQTIFTTTKIDYFPEALLKHAQVIGVESHE